MCQSEAAVTSVYFLLLTVRTLLAALSVEIAAKL